MLPVTARKRPRAINVVTTGIPVTLSSTRGSTEANALSSLPPTYSTGRHAAAISHAASRACLACDPIAPPGDGQLSGTGRYGGNCAAGTALRISR